MEHALFALPIQSGKSQAARSFLQELEHGRKDQYAASERRLGDHQRSVGDAAEPDG
jgi:hypothetical protein